MDKETNKIDENLMPTKQTYPTVQIVTDNTITHRHALKQLASLKTIGQP